MHAYYFMHTEKCHTAHSIYMCTVVYIVHYAYWKIAWCAQCIFFILLFNTCLLNILANARILVFAY